MQSPVKEKNRPTLLLYVTYASPTVGWGERTLHSHDFCEIMFVREGQGKIAVGKTEFPVAKGDVVVFNPGTKHCEFWENGNTSVTFLGISNLNIDGLKPSCLCKDDFAIMRSYGDYEVLCFYLDRLFAEKEIKSSLSASISKHLLNIIISCVLRLSEDTEKATEYKKTYSDIKHFMDEHYTEIDSIDNLCREFFINKYYLTHLFKDAYGIPPLQYVIQKRMALAKHLLVNTNSRVDEVSASCGYSDVAYFCRLFKKTEGITPLKFRKQHRLN